MEPTPSNDEAVEQVLDWLVYTLAKAELYASQAERLGTEAERIQTSVIRQGLEQERCRAQTLRQRVLEKHAATPF